MRFRFSKRPCRLFLSRAVGLIWVNTFLERSVSASQHPNEIFTDITAQAGITWQQFSGESPDRFLIETMGGGVAFLDFDSDGLQDIFFVNGGETPHGKSPVPVRNALYHNDGTGAFEYGTSPVRDYRYGLYGMVAAGCRG